MDILSLLKKLPHYIPASKKQIVLRCQFCGDSKHDKNAKRMYVKTDVDINKNEKYLYYCFNCNAKGVVDLKFLKAFNLLDEIDSNELNELKKLNSASSGKSFSKKRSKHRLKIITYDNPVNNKKIEYINNRLGINLSFDDLPKYRIILNLYDLLDGNNINYLNENEYIVNKLDRNYVGFLSTDNGMVSLRNIHKKEYHIYNIYGNNESKRHYTIPNKIDLLSKDFEIIITEGAWDLVGIFYHVYNREQRSNRIYIANMGTGYDDCIKELIKIGIVKFKLSIYADNDQNVNLYKNVVRKFAPFITRYEVFINSYPNEKDFGVPKSNIKLKKLNI